MRKILAMLLLLSSLACSAQSLQVVVKSVDIGATRITATPYQAPYGPAALSGVTGNFGNESLSVTVSVTKANNGTLSYFYMDSYLLDSLSLGTKYLKEEMSQSFATTNGREFVVSRSTPINLSPDAARRPYYLIVVLYASYTYNGVEYPSITVSKTRVHAGAVAPLPVTLTSFDAVAMDSRVHITWTTATELNASHYELEKSENGNAWKIVTVVSAKGAGNYSTYDGQEDGFVYYRLKEVDTDGKIQYSAVRTAAFGSNVLSVVYYDLVGRRIAKPNNGFFVEVTTYTTGQVVKRKVYQQ